MDKITLCGKTTDKVEGFGFGQVEMIFWGPFLSLMIGQVERIFWAVFIFLFRWRG